MFLQFLVCFLIANFIRKNINADEIKAGLDRGLYLLRFVVFAAWGLMYVVSGVWEVLLHLTWISMAAFLSYILWLKRDVRILGNILTCTLPYFIWSLISLIVEEFFVKFYKEYDYIFEFGALGAIIWMAAYGISIANQQKSIKKEEEKRRIIQGEKEKLEHLVAERTEAILLQKTELEKTVENLKLTQDQLVQSEKLASLGELTAGIAHEIQNPLNFVNNFSEINSELLVELKEEIAKGNQEEVAFIIKDLLDNEEKIVYHGKRADAIVKSMLLHSRSTDGRMEPTNINLLADEYLRLSYHGLRAKDKRFNSDFKAILEPDLPLIEVKPQDIGRVILNLLNNAFYAVNERKLQGDSAYKPEVNIYTRDKKDYIEIEVKDNGVGIPKEALDKIYQPFFTSKPAGSGTGLGLSLSYDIITKGHLGSLTVDSQEGIGTSFIIRLPKKIQP